MNIAKLRTLLDKVAEKTAHGELDWQETANRDEYLVSFESGALIIGYRRRDEDEGAGVPEVQVLLLDRSSMIAEQHIARPGAEEYDQLCGLLTAARSSVRNGDEVLDAILEELR
jgi:hypothetical protein